MRPRSTILAAAAAGLLAALGVSIWAAGRDDRPLGISKAEVNSFGEDSEGRIYFASLATGKVFAILPE